MPTKISMPSLKNLKTNNKLMPIPLFVLLDKRVLIIKLLYSSKLVERLVSALHERRIVYPSIIHIRKNNLVLLDQMF
jgi:hypothetical protein